MDPRFRGGDKFEHGVVSMIRATSVARAGTWPEAEARDRVTLDFDERFRRRKVLYGEGGLQFLLELDAATALRDGDGLALEGGGYVRVAAAPESLIEVKARDAETLARLAWHLGNRHLPVEILPGGLRIRDDHVIVAMLEGLGATVARVTAPFTPEGGAYDPAHGHGHHHDDHDHHH